MSRPLAADAAALHLAAIADSSEDAILSLDTNGIIQSWNAAAERMFGFTAEQIIGQPIRRLVPPERTDEHADLVRRVFAGDVVRRFETERCRHDGSRLPVSLSLTPIRAADGAVIGAAGVIRDNSHRDRGEQAARRLAALVASSDDAIISKDLNGVITSWNAAAERMFGFTAAEMAGQSIRRIIPADRQAEEDHVLSMIRSGHRVDHFETIRQRKDGSQFPVSLTISPIVDTAGRIVGASKIARDVTENKQAEAERARLLDLAQRQAHVTRTLNHVGAIVASSLDREAIIQSVTDAARLATGAEIGAFFYNVTDAGAGESYRLYALSGAPREAFASFPHPRATPLFAPTFHGQGPVRIADVTKDHRYGQTPPYYGMPPGHLPVRSYLAVPVTARSGEVLGGLFFGHSAAGAFSEEHEQVVSGIAAWASVALENARLYVMAQESNRLKDEFLATFSHELRTPLNAIIGYARMVRDGVLTGAKQSRALDTIERNAAALAAIVNDVLDVSRIMSGKISLNVERLDVAALLRDAVDAIVPSAAAKNIAVDVSADGTAYVSADRARIQQVLWNVLSNAVKFTPPGGRVSVSLSTNASEAQMTVTDTGVGIAPEFLPYIFERFSQGETGPTRERGGLGLGLSIASHLVQLHGGSIEASSPGAGLGTTMRIMLPLARAMADAAVHTSRRDESI
jgi:PAS domain S-box-containing protein